MQVSTKDMRSLRQLAESYAEIAHSAVQQERIKWYKQINATKNVRPVVLIDEVPRGEIQDESLTTVCSPEVEWLEAHLRRTLYQWEHFQVDMVVPPVFWIPKVVQSTGIGLSVRDSQIQSETGTYAAAHQYVDQLQTEEDLAKLREPEIIYKREGTEALLQTARSVFDGLMDVKAKGHAFHYSFWDMIACFRGVDNLLMDLAVRP